MKKNTRNEILEAARTLFNQYGYNGVSLRDIAGAVGISKGNLTYHFSKKEDIVESLLEMEQDTFPTKTPCTLQELDEVFLDMQQAIQAHLYFFLHHAQLAQVSPAIFQKQRARYADMQIRLKAAFTMLCKNGLFREELFAGEYDRLIDSLYMAAAYWAPFSQLQKSVSQAVSYRSQIWSTLFHVLTEKGRTELRTIMDPSSDRSKTKDPAL